jgi:hypothetical protein
MANFDIKFEALGGIIPAAGQTFLPMSMDEVRSIEGGLRTELPPEYVAFLLSYGAVAFAEIVEFEPVVPLPPPISDDGAGFINYFYGAARSVIAPGFWLSKAIEVYKGRMPENVIPIADDSGNKICIGTAGDERGRVFYWDHHDEWDERDYSEYFGTSMPQEVKFQNLYRIAASFDDLIDRLRRSENV